MRPTPALVAICALALVGGVAAHGQAAQPYHRAALEAQGWRPAQTAPVWPAARRGLMRQLPDFLVSVASPRPLSRPVAFDHVPDEMLLKLPPLEQSVPKTVEETVSFSDLDGLRIVWGPAQAAPVDASRARDLIRVAAFAEAKAGKGKAALDDSAALAYATCAAADHATAQGYGWLRRISAGTKPVGAGSVAEIIFTLTRDAPEGQAISASAVITACAKTGIPTQSAPGERTGDEG